MAYAAAFSLSQILEQISNPYVEQHQTPLQDQQIISLQEKLNFLLDFLEHSLQRRSEEVQCLERDIRDAAYITEDIIESHVSKNFSEEGFQERQMRDQTFCVNFKIVADEIDRIKTKADMLTELWGTTDVHRSQRSTSLPTGQSSLLSIGKNDMVGFREDLLKIMDRLTGYPPSLKVIPVTGMGGIGKTTLARNVYNHPQIELRFHTRAWVKISQDYREREVLLSLLDSMKQFSAEKDEGNSTEKDEENSTEVLKEYVYKSLKGRRYLVVMDDVWTTEAWDSLRRIFPDDGIGSRILLTTRLRSVVDSPHHMQFLNKIDSWSLLCQKVFGEDSCPIELEEAGKEIAENCKGLPLSLVVIGGHLSTDNRTKDHWEHVARNVKSVVNEADENCSKILSLSYDYLPHKLKACFLYMGVFPEDDKIRISKLIKLWVAEGFLKPVNGKTFEEVAEEYLGELISRNLILIRNKSSRGKIKSCSIHDMLRDLCVRKAQEEKFFHVTVTEKDFRIFAEGIKYSRRLCIHPDIVHKELSNSDNSNVNPSTGSLPPVRSLLCSCSASEIYESGDINLFPLLRVLDLGKGNVDDFPIGETKLVHTRYLSFSCDGIISIPKILPDFLWYLHTLIVDRVEVYLPEEIWRMPQLRHLLFVRCYLPCPVRSPIDGENLVLGNLLTLSKVNSSSCTKEVFERVPNLNKLGILIEQFGRSRTPFSLGNLVGLPQLVTLKISGEFTLVNVQVNFTFPPNIKRLTLQSVRIPWKHMTIFGLMPNLEVLKLRWNAFDGPEWEPTEGEFCKLKFLLLDEINLVQWRANDTHFRSLECLILRRCYKLEEIPLSFGEIQTLQSIDLDDASPSAVTSAKQIQKELNDWGNDSIQVHVHHKFHEIHQAIKELEATTEAEFIARLWSNDDTLQLKATTLFYEILFLDKDQIQPIEEVIPRVFPRFLEFLARDDYLQLQYEAALVISRISDFSSDNIDILIDHGVVPILVSLLNSPKDVLRIKALHMLGNFAYHSTKARDLFVSDEVLMPLMKQLNDKTNLSIMRNATHALSNLCRGEPWPQSKHVKSALLHLSHLIHTKDKDVLINTCCALSYITNWTKDIIQAVIDVGVFPRLVELLLYPPFVVYPALYIVDTIIRIGDDIQIQVESSVLVNDAENASLPPSWIRYIHFVNKALLLLFIIIDNGTFPCLLNLLTQNYDDWSKNVTCQIISDIIERSKNHVQAVIEAGIISPLVQLLQNTEFEIQDEAARAIFNATVEGTNEQIKFLVDKGCINPLCDLLVSPNRAVIIKYCLGGLENILKVGEAEKNQGNTKDVNVFAKMIDDAGGLQKIKNLQTYDNSEICEEAVKILETYWQEEDDEQLRSGDAQQSGCFCCTFIDRFLCFLP